MTRRPLARRWLEPQGTSLLQGGRPLARGASLQGGGKGPPSLFRAPPLLPPCGPPWAPCHPQVLPVLITIFIHCLSRTQLESNPGAPSSDHNIPLRKIVAGAEWPRNPSGICHVCRQA